MNILLFLLGLLTMIFAAGFYAVGYALAQGEADILRSVGWVALGLIFVGLALCGWAVARARRSVRTRI
jgi:hypothetical protein